jgi:hypothetical protein
VTEQRYEAALDLADAAERLVRAAEADLAQARTYTERDVAETELQAALATQDAVLEEIAPEIERRRAAVRDQAFEAMRAADGTHRQGVMQTWRMARPLSLRKSGMLL